MADAQVDPRYPAGVRPTPGVVNRARVEDPRLGRDGDRGRRAGGGMTRLALSAPARDPSRCLKGSRSTGGGHLGCPGRRRPKRSDDGVVQDEVLMGSGKEDVDLVPSLIERQGVGAFRGREPDGGS